MKTIHLKCGHKISVRTWPSKVGLAKVRHHYKKFHPARMKKMTKESLATKRKKGLIKKYGTTSKLARRYLKGKKDYRTGKQLRISKETRKSVERNPAPALIYDKLLTIEARKEHGKFKGQNFYHDFKKDTDAVVMGNPDGSLTIRSKKGKPLWKRFSY